MQLDAAIDQFLKAKRRENRTQATLDTYEYNLFHFAKAMPECGDTADLDHFTVNTYIDRLMEGGTLQDVTIATRVRHLRAFTRWCVGMELTRSDPFAGGRMAKAKVPDFERKDVETITPDNFRRLLGECDTSRDVGRRDKAMYMFLLDTGVRVGELVGLKVEDVDLKMGLAKVVGKGRKWRTVFFGPETAVALSRYLSRRPARRESDYLFSGQRGQDRLTGGGVRQRMTKLGKAAGCTQTIHPHLFRHTMATEALRNGMSPAEVQRILGHADITTTIKNYTHLVTEDLRSAHEAHSPMSRFVR